MKRLHVAVDLDDVCLDFTGGVKRSVEIEYGVQVPEITAWNLHDTLDPIIGHSWWKWMKARDWLWPNFPAIPGAVGGIQRMRDAGHYVELVTSKPLWAEAAVWKWLGKWRLPVQRVTIVDMNTRKVDATDADGIVDDKPETTLDFAQDGRFAIMFARSHNESVYQSEQKYEEAGVVVAKDWNDVVRLVEEEAS